MCSSVSWKLGVSRRLHKHVTLLHCQGSANCKYRTVFENKPGSIQEISLHIDIRELVLWVEGPCRHLLVAKRPEGVSLVARHCQFLGDPARSSSHRAPNARHLKRKKGWWRCWRDCDYFVVSWKNTVSVITKAFHSLLFWKRKTGLGYWPHT